VLEAAGEPFPTGLRMLYDKSVQEISTRELWMLQIRRGEFAKQYLDAWNKTANLTKSGRPIDAIIRFPLQKHHVMVVPLPRIQQFCMTNLMLELRTLQFGICWVLSSLNDRVDPDYPGATFPVTFASAEKDLKLASYIPISEVDKQCYEQCIVQV
jgi:hypothetical protein